MTRLTRAGLRAIFADLAKSEKRKEIRSFKKSKQKNKRKISKCLKK